MVTDNKKVKADPAPKSGAAAKDKNTAVADGAKAETKASETKAETKTETKPDAGESAAAPSSYSRGEGQKPVTAAYKENWNAIFGKKSKKKKR
ncbi:MAG: hypothetical protein WAL80_19080 [Xanthobacteraceae bacterium]|jgi:hypothetical protein